MGLGAGRGESITQLIPPNAEDGARVRALQVCHFEHEHEHEHERLIKILNFALRKRGSLLPLHRPRGAPEEAHRNSGATCC